MTTPLPPLRLRPPGRLGGALRTALLVVLGACWWLLAAHRGGWPASAPSPTPPAWVVARRDIVVLDGDTYLVRGRVTRLLGADAPEQAHPWFDGAQEPWATRASDLARDALDRATRIEVVPAAAAAGQDGYARDLAHVLVDGRPLGATLVEAGLACETISRFGDGGHPDLAAAVLRAVAPRRRPPFEAPWRWRRAHRVEPRPPDDRGPRR